ncbi:hypothetical protein [Bordetella phage vB_BbrM_PHB04]|uniref:RelA/SpoT domain-containing protein n=1 Tax=Bordetella phage vB_BbrM_PHB04 TaxID=2029657 RepID=A0A291L9W8_9CAUD|nr:hypothetical protein HOS14_gp034 [Bordetella phage vB_BbrM_PHB04]ATI15652.1 hypothetical protein [Bordetella phage vB_BbrM_PHB04]
MKKAKPQQEPERVPGVEIGDHVYFQHGDGPRAGCVRAHGKHGCTVDCDGEDHRVPWGKVLGHKKRAAQRYTILDEGEDGMIVEDAAGQRRYLSIPPDADEDKLVTKSLGADGRVLLFFKADNHDMPPANRAGLTRKQIVDRTGRKQTKWVRTDKGQPAQRKPAAHEDPAAAGAPRAKPGDKVRFKAGDFEGEGEIVGEPGADGAHVKDASGRVHQVRWSEIADQGAAAPAPANDSGALFTADELAKLPAKVNQPVKSWEELVEKGTEGLGQFREQLGKVAQVMGLQSGKKPDDITPEEWESDTGFLFIAPLKGEKRAKEKVEADYDGDWSQLRDIVRATISVPSMGSVKQALGHLRDAGIELAQKPKDRFAKPTDEGYRDLMTIVKLPNGMLAELQIHVKAMTLAKEEGHEHYNVSRSLQAKYGEAEPGDKWSDEDHRKFYEALKAQKEIYDTAWSKASGAGQSGVDGKQQQDHVPLQKAAPFSKMIMLIRRT